MVWSDKKDNIEKIIISLPEDYVATKSDVEYFKQYDVCNPAWPSSKERIPEFIVRKIWKSIKDTFANLEVEGGVESEDTSAVSILSINSGGGTILCKAPSNTIITAYNVNYICKRITDFTCQEKANEGRYFSSLKSISQFFAIKNTNSSRKYDIVMVESDDGMWEGIDFETNRLSKLSHMEYYLKRGRHFLNENGLLVVVCSERTKEKLMDDRFGLVYKKLDLKDTIEGEGYYILIYQNLKEENK